MNDLQNVSGDAIGAPELTVMTHVRAADTAPDVFANTQSQMRSVYGNLDRDQTLVMIDFVLREAVTATRKSNEVGSSSSNTRGQDLVTGLNSLNDLHERGLLNEEEFNAAKRRLLGL